MPSIDVVLLSGQSVTVQGGSELTVRELRQNAQRQLQVKLFDLFLGQVKLEPWSTLGTLNLKDGDVVSANVWQPKLCSSHHSDAFAIVYEDAVLWGDPLVEPMERLELQEVRDVKVSSGAFAALLSDGSVYTWGAFFSGGHVGSARTELYQVKLLEASHRAFAALRADGRVVAWGDLGFGGDCSAVENDLEQVWELRASRRAFAAVRQDGTVVTWGDAKFGGDSSAVQEQLFDVVSLAATEQAFAAVRADGQVITWGGIKGAPTLKDVEILKASHRAFAAYSRADGLVAWGDPEFGGDFREKFGVEDDVVLEIQATAGAFAARLSNGEVICWGHPDLGGKKRTAGRGADHSKHDSNELQLHDSLHDVQQIAATAGAFAAVTSAEVITWGSLHAGAAKDSLLIDHLKDLKGSASSFLALKDDSFIAWGRGTYEDSPQSEAQSPESRSYLPFGSH